MKTIGEHLKRIRLDWGKSLRKLSHSFGVSHQLLDKVERGLVKPSDSLLLKYSNGFNIPLDTLRIINYTDELMEGMGGIQRRRDVLKVVNFRMENPNEWVHIPNSDPLKKETIRKPYVRGGKGGKVKGFGYYIQPNEKLKKRERKELIRLGELYMGPINSGELDSSLTDGEIVDEWNRFFDEYGYRFPEFEEEWLKLHIPKEKVKVMEDPTLPPNFFDSPFFRRKQIDVSELG